MKKKKSLIFISLFLIVLGGCKKINDKEMTVVKNCTGIYLIYNSKTYKVCNYEEIINYPDGAKVNATIKKIKNCSIDQSQSVCTLHYDNNGWIEVLDVK